MQTLSYKEQCFFLDYRGIRIKALYVQMKKYSINSFSLTRANNLTYR